jgi:hypothetical protein
MNIREFLAPTDVLADFAALGKASLLQGLAQRASHSLNLPAELISSALLKREELGSILTQLMTNRLICCSRSFSQWNQTRTN